MDDVKAVPPVLLPECATLIQFPHDEKMAAYRRLLAIHDWQFEHCDNYRIWGAGKAQRNALEAFRRDIDPDGIIWNQFAPHGHHYSRIFGKVAG